MSKARPVALVLLFVLAGPPVGTLTFATFASAYSAFVLGTEPPDWSVVIPVIVTLGYVWGVLPVLLAGIADVGLIGRKWPFARRLLTVTAVGAAASALTLVVVFRWFAITSQGGIRLEVVLTALALTGAVAALVATLLAELLVRRV